VKGVEKWVRKRKIGDTIEGNPKWRFGLMFFYDGTLERWWRLLQPKAW